MVKQVNLCIVGGAGAGLSAAVKAKELGVENVIVLEKMKHPGGCTKMAGGMFGIDTPVQKRRGLYYNVDELFKEIIGVLNWEVDAMLVRKWLNGAGENIRWLESLGVEFDYLRPFNGIDGEVRSTYHANKASGFRTGYLIAEALEKKAREQGVEILTSTRAEHLIKNEDGSVGGVVAKMADGETLTVYADAVVLATGSISSNKELIGRFYQGEEYKNMRIMANVAHNTGDGLIMAEEIGAGTGLVSTLFIGPHNHFPNASECTGTLIRRPQALRVNRNGERIQDESWCVTNEFGWMLGVNIDKQPGKVIYGIVDSSLLKDMQEHERAPLTVVEDITTHHGRKEHSTLGDEVGAEAAFREGEWLDHVEEDAIKEQAAGRAIVCDTLEEAAAWMGCKPEVLKDTIQRYNSYCDSGYDADFLKDPRFMHRIDTPPYYVFRGPSGIDTCIGGLRIDSRQQVLDKESYVIPGLYAAGVMTSGWSAHNYAIFGAEMSYTIYSGRSAAENALTYMQKKAAE